MYVDVDQVALSFAISLVDDVRIALSEIHDFDDFQSSSFVLRDKLAELGDYLLELKFQQK